MDATSQNVVPNTYIAEWIKLDFSNNSNLKTDIQNRISVKIESDFINALNDMKGDNKNGYGISFSEITLLALAYFYSEIFTYKIKDNYYTLETVKGFLDADNLTDYTEIHQIDVRFYKLNKTPYFKHCWLIIQSAWFFNSEFFGHHQHIDYVNNYINTGQKLLIEDYNYDRIYLEKKYNEIDNAKTKKIPINSFSLVNHWYFGILFLICKELQLSTKHFNISNKCYREYNPLTKTSRQLRPLAPFKIIECDIKSAFPTFLDIEIHAKLKDRVYNNLMQSQNITRGEAKILFNTICNSGKYKSKEFTKRFFMDCGYTETQSAELLYYTHNEKDKFISFMTEQEQNAINGFIISNNLQRGARLHDAIIFIDDNIKPSIFKIKPNCDFGYKELNTPIFKESFMMDSKRLPYAYIKSIPAGFNLITKNEEKKSSVKGVANGFKFYTEKYNYINANFNLNNYFEIKDKDPRQFFYNQCETMLCTLFYLNKRKLKPFELFTILKHIRQYGNFIFNVRSLYFRLIKYQFNRNEIRIKSRDFDIIVPKLWLKNIDFLNDLGKAKMMVNIDNNHYNLFALLQERIINNDYDFLTEAIIKGKRPNNSLTYAIINKFNLLVTGRQRKERKGFKKDPLYNNSIKEVLIKSLSLKPQQQNAFIKKGITKYESELLAMNRLINNRKTAEQLLLILSDILGTKTVLTISKNIEIQNQLKFELIQDILKIEINNIDAGVNCFDFHYESKSKLTNKIKPITDLNDNFNTDLSNSVFNQVSIEQAHNRGDKFFNEYLKFNEKEIKKETEPIKKKEAFKFPEIDFDNLY